MPITLLPQEAPQMIVSDIEAGRSVSFLPCLTAMPTDGAPSFRSPKPACAPSTHLPTALIFSSSSAAELCVLMTAAMFFSFLNVPAFSTSLLDGPTCFCRSCSRDSQLRLEIKNDPGTGRSQSDRPVPA